MAIINKSKGKKIFINIIINCLSFDSLIFNQIAILTIDAILLKKKYKLDQLFHNFFEDMQ